MCHAVEGVLWAPWNVHGPPVAPVWYLAQRDRQSQMYPSVFSRKTKHTRIIANPVPYFCYYRGRTIHITKYIPSSGQKHFFGYATQRLATFEHIHYTPATSCWKTISIQPREALHKLLSILIMRLRSTEKRKRLLGSIVILHPFLHARAWIAGGSGRGASA